MLLYQLASNTGYRFTLRSVLKSRWLWHAAAWAVAEWRLDRDLEEFLSELAVDEGMLPLD